MTVEILIFPLVHAAHDAKVRNNVSI